MVVVSLLPRISIVTSPGSSLHDVLLSMRFGLTRHLPLKRSFSNYSITSVSPEQQLKSPVTMATTESKNLVEASKEETNKKETEDKKEVGVSVPPPPEKPEPGDCCGSGCVRCVWDVYYDELEDYNKQLSGETKSIWLIFPRIVNGEIKHLSLSIWWYSGFVEQHFGSLYELELIYLWIEESSDYYIDHKLISIKFAQRGNRQVTNVKELTSQSKYFYFLFCILCSCFYQK